MIPLATSRTFGARSIHTICFANTTNTHVGEPRAKDWDEVYDLVKKSSPAFVESPAMGGGCIVGLCRS